jgi:hypothetical protein
MWANENHSYNADASISSISNFNWPNFDNFITYLYVFLSVPKHIIKSLKISTNKTCHFFSSSRKFYCMITENV